MNIPNTLTLARILMVPILVVVLLTKVKNHEIYQDAKNTVLFFVKEA